MGTTSSLQDLILRAAFLPGKDGTEAWEQWKSAFDLDGHVDLATFRLLPEVVRRLREEGVQDPVFKKLSGISRKHWLANRLYFRDLEALLRSLREHDIEVLIAGGSALALAHYPSYPLNLSINSVVTVPPTQATAAFKLMLSAGWSPIPPVTERCLKEYVAARSWHAFRDPTGRPLRLHWHVLAELARADVDEEFWSVATDMTIGAETVRALSPADELLHLCCQGVSLRIAPRFIRAADVMLLLRARRGDVDWDRLLVMAKRPGATMPVVDTLGYLQDRLAAPVPAPVFEQLLALPVTRSQRREYDLRNRPMNWVGDMAGLWFNYRRATGTRLVESVLRFPRFLQHYLRLEHLWLTPFHAVAKAAEGVRRRDAEVAELWR